MKAFASFVTRAALTAGLAGFFAGLSHRAVVVLLLQLRGVVENDLGDLASGVNAVNRPAKSSLDEERKAAAVVEMAVREEDGVDLAGLEREGFPVELRDLPAALEQAAVDEDAAAAGLDAVTAPGDGEGGSCAEELHVRVPTAMPAARARRLAIVSERPKESRSMDRFKAATC